MKKLILVIVYGLVQFWSYSQDWETWIENRADSLRKINNKQTFRSLIYNSNSDGLFYLGLTNSFELSSYFMGGEFKMYDSYYSPLLSMSLYSNYRITPFNLEKNYFSSFSLGVHCTFLGLESIVYSTNKINYFYLTPKLGFDYGSWSLFYGYNLPISTPRLEEYSGHNISFKYHLYLSSFKYHKMRKKSMGY